MICKKSAFTVVRGGCHLSIEGIQKGYHFCQKWHVKGAYLDRPFLFPEYDDIGLLR